MLHRAILFGIKAVAQLDVNIHAEIIMHFSNAKRLSGALSSPNVTVVVNPSFGIDKDHMKYKVMDI